MVRWNKNRLTALKTETIMIYFVNGKAKFTFGDKSMQDNAKEVLENMKYGQVIKNAAA